MVRTASAVLAVLILSGFVAMQQVATHTVVRGDTLWDLAEHYYNDPFQWRRIWEANRDKINDPNLIYPDQVFALPGREAEVSGVTVEPAAAQPTEPTQANPQRPPTAARPPQMPPGPAPSPNSPTIFRRDTTLSGVGIVDGRTTMGYAVSPVMVLAAPWVVRVGNDPEYLGEVAGFAGGASSSETVREYDRIRLSFEGTPPPAGTRLQAFRRDKIIDKVGQVMVPTGVITITEVDGNEAAAVVSRELDRMTIGNYLRAVPEYEPTMDTAQPVSDGAEAMVMGFAGPSVVQDVGNIAFLDQGSDDGVTIGDEYEYINPAAGTGVVEGRLQVVGLTSGMAAARIVSMDDTVFHQGIVVRLARKMR